MNTDYQKPTAQEEGKIQFRPALRPWQTSTCCHLSKKTEPRCFSHLSMNMSQSGSSPRKFRHSIFERRNAAQSQQLQPQLVLKQIARCSPHDFFLVISTSTAVANAEASNFLKIRISPLPLIPHHDPHDAANDDLFRLCNIKAEIWIAFLVGVLGLEDKLVIHAIHAHTLNDKPFVRNTGRVKFIGKKFRAKL
ncbi:MAG: hypothetical protein QM579_04525 [Desulfovibrio sp.]|uniref:hypothetical protein n=1 Tax=Desulfovibrio sp. TaxID=885 RepID=UPI0039E416E1